MYQGDPTINGTQFDHDHMKLDQLGMEAKAILKSIQTEDSKLQQSGQLMRSDLHYFRARFNYYRLSLMRLLPEERKTLEPVLSNFRCHIVENEAGVGDSKSEASYTPFLAPVENKSSPGPKLPEGAVVSSKAQASDAVLNDLRLVRLALTGQISPDSAPILIQALDRVIAKIENN